VPAALPGADAVIMAAAIADYRPAQPADRKLKKREQGDVMSIALRRTADVLQAIIAKRDPRTIVVGFKAETGDPVGDASRMLLEKRLGRLQIVPIAIVEGDGDRASWPRTCLERP